MTRPRQFLACVAPPSYEELLTSTLEGLGYSVRFFIRKLRVSGSRSGSIRWDPYDLRQVVDQTRRQASGIVLVAPKGRSPRRVSPSPLLGGLPVGLLFSNQPRDLMEWSQAHCKEQNGLPAWVVLSMNRQSYLSRSREFAEYLRARNRAAVKTWFGDCTTRHDLCERLALGPRMVVYIGHGRARGLSGYLGLRWHHLAEYPARAPVGTVLCFACDTLKHERGQPSFGCRWVMSGRALTYLGSVDAVSVKANTNFARAIGKVFKLERPDSVGALLRRARHHIEADPTTYEDAIKAFRTYRIIGNPLQPLLL